MDTKEFLSRATKSISKKSEVKEIDIEDTFCKYANKLGCKALKLIILNKRGFPDRTVLCKGGRLFFIEFKKKGKSIRQTQSKVRTMLESFGFEYYVCDVKGQAESILDEFLAFDE